MTQQKKKKVAPKKVAKKNSAMWQPYWVSNKGTYDAFGTQPEPNKMDLVRAYEDIVYACVSLIVHNISCVPIRLYVKTGTGQRKPKCETRRVEAKCIEKVKSLGMGANVEEVTSHPLLDLIHKCNPYHNKHGLVELTQIYLELTGNAFWLMNFNGLGIPEELYLLPSQYVFPERDENFFVKAWRFGQGSEQKLYDLRSVCHFKFANPLDPYGEGVSPLRGAWQRKIIGGKELSYLDNILTNQARPDGILAIKDSISPFEGERLAKEFGQRFQTHGEGGILVTDGTMNYAPINYAPRDLAELQLYQVIKTTVCNCFHIPPDIFELGESNRATAETAVYYLAMHCLKPRVEKLVQRMNDKLIPFFDDRLFFCADPVVPEDKQFELQKRTSNLQQGVLTRDEVRQMEGLESQEWAKEPLLPSGMLPALLDVPEQQEVPQVATPQDRSAQGAAILQLQTAYYTGQLPRAAVLAQAVHVFGFSPEEAEALFPEAPQPQPPGATPGASPEPPQKDDLPPTKGKGCSCCGQRQKGLIDVPDYRQQGNYDCGAAVTHSVAALFGVGADSEDAMIEALGTNQSGTSPQAIIAYLKSLGLQVEAKNGLTVDDLATMNGEGKPVICCIQDYGTPQEEAKDESGHYVVVVDIDPQNITIQDPSAGRVEMSREDFDTHWHDEGADGTVYDHFGIAVGQSTGKPETKDEDDCIAHKIPILLREGYSKEQAAAIAYSMCGKKSKKSVRKKAFRQKSPMALIKAVQKFFRKQSSLVLGEVKSLDEAQTKAFPPSDWFNINSWTRAMFEELSPILGLYYEHGARAAVAELGVSPTLFSTVQPNLRKGVERASLLFCEETNRTTAMELSTALDMLRKEITEGLVEGDVKNAMMERVQKVFESASNERAFRIGVTEASRGQHAALELTAQESGVATGKKWLLSDDACPLCLPLSGKSVGLGENFTVDGNGPYAAVPYPPRHPNCRCTLLLEAD